jgi:cytoskeleton protein RodZ
VIALAVLSLLLFYQWWHLVGSKPSPVATVPPVAVPHQAAQPAAPAKKAEPVAETPAAVPTPEPGTPLENLYETPSDESGLGEATAAPPAPVAAKTASAPAVTSPVAAAPAPTVAATGGNAVQTAQSAAEPKPQVAPDAATGPLVMRFNDDCWVVVRDASGRALLQGLIKSGQRHVLDGKPPFQLTLGNAPAVEIEYLGQRFDQSSYTGPSRIARFTLGK